MKLSASLVVTPRSSREPDVSEEHVVSIFGPKDRGCMFLRNIGLSSKYTAFQLSRLYLLS
jgi:hypothetical protein